MGLSYSIAFHRIYPRLAAALDIPLVPFLLSGVVLNPALNGGDGVHPNAEGARRIAATVWRYLEPMLGGEGQRSRAWPRRLARTP
jgi:acyl-CoA thioesterase-1